MSEIKLGLNEFYILNKRYHFETSGNRNGNGNGDENGYGDRSKYLGKREERTSKAEIIREMEEEIKEAERRKKRKLEIQEFVFINYTPESLFKKEKELKFIDHSYNKDFFVNKKK
jgi:hypothetical protein